MTRVTVPRPNLYHSSDGFSVEILGRTGLRYTESGQQIFVDSEVLMAPAGIMIYKDSMVHWESAHPGSAIQDAERERVVKNIVETLASQGIDVQVL